MSGIISTELNVVELNDSTVDIENCRVLYPHRELVYRQLRMVGIIDIEVSNLLYHLEEIEIEMGENADSLLNTLRGMMDTDVSIGTLIDECRRVLEGESSSLIEQVMATNTIFMGFPQNIIIHDRLIFSNNTRYLPVLQSSLIHLDLSGNLISWFRQDNLRRLEYLDLSHNRIERGDVHVYELSLRYLNLSHNNISRLDPKIFFSEFIEILDLSYNNISVINRDMLERLPLRKLILNNNSISSFISVDTLEYLDLGSNAISRIPTSINRMRLLRYLDVSHNLLRSIPKKIPWLQLDISYNRLTEYPENKLKSIDITGNRIDKIPENDNIINEMQYSMF